jgi:hypothetical protein
MDRIEQRVRDSLHARAVDVEPTSDLWDEVDRRIIRRRRVRVSVWALAGATAVAAGILVVPGLLGGVISPPEIEPVGPPPATEEPVDEATEEPTDPPADEAPLPGPGEVPSMVVDTSLLTEPVVAVDDTSLALLTSDGATPLVELPEEGHSRFLSVAVRPGSTVDDLTIVTTTTAEAFHDIRWTRVVDGEVVEAYAAFEDQYAPAAATDDMARLSPVVWAPDGDSVAWFDHEADGRTTLRTVGWDDGPGTGSTADDDAGFSLEGLPPGSTPDDWIALDGTRSRIRATHPDSNEGWYSIEMERQADGALALVSVETVGVADAASGPVGALTGSIGDGAPRWLVRLGFDGAVLSDVRDGLDHDLPMELMPGDGFPELWTRPHGEAVLVGSWSTGTVFVIDEDGEAALLTDRLTHLDRLP